MDPTFMPAGYSFHHNVYKAPPGPPSKDIGYAYSLEENEAVLNRWRVALRDLLLKAKANDLVIPDQVVLETDLRQNAFQGSYDSLLREGLHAYGYRIGLQKNPKVPALFYSAYDPVEEGNIHRDPAVLYNDEAESPYKNRQFVKDHKGMTLVIGLVQNGRLIKKVTGLYDLPLYGYQPGAYVSGEENPVRAQNEGQSPRIPMQNGVNP